MTSNIIFRCSHCGKMYKIVNCEQYNGELDAGIDYAYNLYTDFGDTFVVEMINYDDKHTQGFIKCINCNNTSLTSRRCMIEVEDWVADKVFNVKGG